MKLIIGLTALLLSSMTQASGFSCINKEEAIEAATTSIENLRAEIHDKSSLWVSRQRVLEFVSGLEFSSDDSKYLSGVVTKWTCAAGSDCYVGVAVDCKANVSIFQYAD